MHVLLRPSAVLAVVSLVLVSSCGSNSNRGSGASAAGTTAAAGSLEGPTRPDTAAHMAGMQGMGMMGAATMDSMQAHMRMMEGMSADQMKAMLPTHRQMVANMLSRMDGEMRQMNMHADPSWKALADSVRQDLVRMPNMNQSQLRSFMPAHASRMTRLMQMHRTMMGSMKK